MNNDQTTSTPAYLHDGAGGQDLLLHVGVPRRPTHRGEEAHGVLGRHSLPCARLSAHDDGLVTLISVDENGVRVI